MNSTVLEWGSKCEDSPKNLDVPGGLWKQMMTAEKHTTIVKRENLHTYLKS